VIIGTGRDRKTGAMLALLARAEEHGLSYAGSAFFGIPIRRERKLADPACSAQHRQGTISRAHIENGSMGSA
jgi:hypothetical protein